MSNNIIEEIQEKSQKNCIKSKYWASILYMDSTYNLYKDVVEPLNEHFCKFVISPLHNQDVEDLESGELKKPHRHVFFIFDTPKTKNQMEWLISLTTLVGQELIMNKKSYFEYLWHKNEIDKPHYNEKDLMFFNCTKTEFLNEEDNINFLQEFIHSNKIKSVSSLFYYVNQYDKSLVGTIKRNSYLINILVNENKELEKWNTQLN